MRYLRKMVGLGLLGGVLLGAAGLAMLYRSLPQLSGHIVVPGLAQAVEIVRDHYAVPHIYAQTELDAYFALGYVHAQDRLWQMEMQRRLGSGTLAEILGARALDQDRFIRTLGIRHIAAENLRHLDASTQQILAAYARGVNAYLEEGRMLPPEFMLLHCAPAMWTPVDSLVWLKMMAWDLSGNWWEELFNVRLSRRLSPQQIVELFPPYPGETPLRLPDLATLYAALDAPARVLMATIPSRAASGVGSNNWVVDGTRTHSGKPLLANDPHLQLKAPSLWYLAHLHAPNLNVIGATLPGLPTVILGRNAHVAWAYTNTGSDTQDLFVEKISPHDPAQYLTPEGTSTFATVREVIKVQGQPEVEFVVRRSRHGPVISDATAEVQMIMPPGHALALSWVALWSDDLTLQFTVKAATARTGAELVQAARDFHTPQQNIVYADEDGHIGFVAAGRVPVRRAENDAMGLVPVPGWRAQYDWIGFIPFEELPQASDVAGGEIVTANQKITPEGYRYWLTSGWAFPYRANRIHALLDTIPKHTVEDFAAIQRDVKNPVAAALLPFMLQITPASNDERTILERLRRWDTAMAREQPEPLIFAEWLRHLAALIYQEPLGELYDQVGDYRPDFLVNVLSNKDGQAYWCGTAAGEPHCAVQLQRALRLAIARLTRRYGQDVGQWTWGKAHTAIAAHQPFGEVPLLSWLFNVRTAKSGAHDTIDMSDYVYDAQLAMYLGAVGPSVRAIYDLAAPEDAVFILNTGQSGHPLSSHYRDMVRAWAEGRYIPMRTDYHTVLQQSIGRLVLSPWEAER